MTTPTPLPAANPLQEIHVVILFALGVLARDLYTISNDPRIADNEPTEMELASTVLSGINALATLAIVIRRTQEYANIADTLGGVTTSEKLLASKAREKIR